jgi:TRAP-type mannitol/chloroaromatic compound transport system permease small subunit
MFYVNGVIIISTKIIRFYTPILSINKGVIMYTILLTIWVTFIMCTNMFELIENRRTSSEFVGKIVNTLIWIAFVLYALKG